MRTEGGLRDRLWHFQSRYAPYLFVAPFVLLFVVFFAYPLGRSFFLSLHKSIGPRHLEFVGFGNYRFLLTDWLFWWSVVNTAAFTIAFLAIQLPLSLGLALLVNRPWLRSRNFLRFSFFSTHLVGQAFVAVIFAILLDTRKGLLTRAGLPAIPWLTDPNWVMAAVLLAALWLSVGFGMIYFLAALQTVDHDLYDAAQVDGAGAWGRFWHVTLPGIRPVLYFLLFTGTLAGFQLFELPYVLYQGAGPGSRAMTVVLYLFITGFDAGNLGYASAIGWVLMVIVLVIILIQIRLARRFAS